MVWSNVRCVHSVVRLRVNWSCHTTLVHNWLFYVGIAQCVTNSRAYNEWKCGAVGLQLFITNGMARLYERCVCVWLAIMCVCVDNVVVVGDVVVCVGGVQHIDMGLM